MKNLTEYAKEISETAISISGLSPEDWKKMAAVKETTMGWSGEFATLYGKLLYDIPANAGLMAKHGRSDRENGFKVFFERLVCGAPGDAFWAECCVVGFMHASAGVNNGSVIAVQSRLDAFFFKKALGAFQGKVLVETHGAFQRVLATAVAIMVAAYEEAMLTGMTQIGLHERLLTRMRSVAIKKMVVEGRSVLPLMEWSERLAVGLTDIDTQHQKLVSLLNTLHSSSTSGKGNDVLRSILGELVSYTDSHFTYEEGLMEKYGYPDLANHKVLHEKLKNQVVSFNEEFQAGRGTLTADLFLFLRSWLNGHILGSDKLYVPLIKSKGGG